MIAPGHGIYVLDSLNSTDKRPIFQLISTVLLIGATMNDTNMEMHYETSTKDVSVTQE